LFPENAIVSLKHPAQIMGKLAGIFNGPDQIIFCNRNSMTADSPGGNSLTAAVIEI
jgi:hypothetical protein